MSFKIAGQVPVIIGECIASESKFNKTDNTAFDLCFHLTHADDASQSDWIRMEFSEDYGKGNFADRKQKEISLDTLHKMGVEGEDLSVLFDDASPLHGKKAVVFIKENPGDKGTFYNPQYFVTGAAAPYAMDKNEAKKRMAALFGRKGDGAAATATASEKPAATGAAASTHTTTADYNPFKKCSCGKMGASASRGKCMKCETGA